MTADLIYLLYKDKRTVFTFQEIAMLVNEPDFAKLKQRVNYFVQTNRIKNLRRGIYAKENYSAEELACKIFKPSYISLEYVLQKAGIIFQYDSGISGISYLSRSLVIDGNTIVFRKLKNEILYNSKGIIMNDKGVSIATPERALLDLLYLNKEFYFDLTKSINKDIAFDLLPIYQSNLLDKRLQKLFENA